MKSEHFTFYIFSYLSIKISPPSYNKGKSFNFFFFFFFFWGGGGGGGGVHPNHFPRISTDFYYFFWTQATEVEIPWLVTDMEKISFL